jgi:hypothetical protein
MTERRRQLLEGKFAIDHQLDRAAIGKRELRWSDLAGRAILATTR